MENLTCLKKGFFLWCLLVCNGVVGATNFSGNTNHHGCFPSPESTSDIRWSALTDQSGDAPDRNDIVVVGADDRLIIDAGLGNDPAEVKGLLIFGELTVEDAGVDLSLIADWVLVAAGGQFNIGTPETPFSSKFELVLAGDQSDQFSLDDVVNETAHLLSTSQKVADSEMLRDLERMVGDDNYNFLMATGANAVISIHTTDEDKASWTQLSQTAQPGDDLLYFAAPTHWEIGDRIVVASTDFDLNQAEDFEVVDVFDQGTSIKLDRPLAFMHFGEVETYANGERSWTLDMRAEVGLLTRKVKLRGDVDYNTNRPVNNQRDTYGGHTMVMHGGEMYLSGVEFEYMGQGGKLGRYPAHWHLNGPVAGQYIKNSSSHHVFNKGWTIHGAQGALMENNVVYESISHCYFLEDGAEVDNQLLHNLAINARLPQDKDKVESNDGSPSGFWIENAENTFHGNHVAGSEKHGFWFELRGINGSSRGLFDDLASREGPRDFVNNTVHSIPDKSFGLAHGELVLSENYKGTDARPQVVAEDWWVEDLTIYKGGGNGIWVRGIGGIFNEVKMAEVDEGTRLRFNQEIRNSFIGGRTTNIGNPEPGQERTLPPGDGDFVGHQIYDGPAGLNQVHFAGFYAGNDHPIDESNAVQKSTLHYVNKVTFADDTPKERWVSMSRTSLAQKTEAKGMVDMDGSLAEVGGSQLISELRGDRSIYEGPNSTFNEDWNAIINEGAFLGSLKFRDFDQDNADLVITRSDGAMIDDFPIGGQQFMVFVGESYHLSFTNAPQTFQFYLSDVPWGSSITCELAGLGAEVQLSLEPGYGESTEILEVNSQAALAAATQTAVLRKPSAGTVVLKFVAQMKHGWLFPQPHLTYHEGLVGGVLVNVDLAGGAMTTNTNHLLEEGTLVKEALILYPNPTSDFLMLMDGVDADHIKLTSINGKIDRVIKIDANRTVDVSTLAKGWYAVHLEKEGRIVGYGKVVLK